jgi:uncharacterized protein YegL
VSDHLGPALAAKPLHVFWLLDVSGSMAADGKIDALNTAMSDAVSSVRDAAADNPGVQVKVRVITFANDADWHVGEPVDIEEFTWTDVTPVDRGKTEAGRAIALATEGIQEVSSAGRGLPPAVVLVSDGKPTDLATPTFGAAIRALDAEPWGRKSSRMAIGIGQDADMDALARFIGHDEIEPLRAGNADELRHYLRWASTVVVSHGAPPAALTPDASRAEPAPPAPARDTASRPAAPPRSRVRSDIPRPQSPSTQPVSAKRADRARRPAGPPRGPARRDLPPPPGAQPPSDVTEDDAVW